MVDNVVTVDLLLRATIMESWLEDRVDGVEVLVGDEGEIGVLRNLRDLINLW